MTIFRSSLFLLAALLITGPRLANATDEPALEIGKGQKVAFVGNSLAERMNLFGHFETRMQIRFAETKPVFRNFGWPADAVEKQIRPGNYTVIDDPFLVYSPEVLICFFGFNESYTGSEPGNLAEFKTNYESYLASISQKLTDAGGKQPTFALVSPIAFESTGNQFQPDGIKENANLEAYTKVIRELAAERKLPFVDLFTPTKKLFGAETGAQFTINGCHLNEAGDKAVAAFLDEGLFWKGHHCRSRTVRKSPYGRQRQVVAAPAGLSHAQRLVRLRRKTHLGHRNFSGRVHQDSIDGFNSRSVHQRSDFG